MSSAAILLLFYRRHLHSARAIISADRKWRLRAPDSSAQDPVAVHAHCTEGMTASEGREGANWVGGGNGDVNGDGDGAGTGTGVEASERKKYGNGARGRTQDGNGDGSGDGDKQEQ